MRPGDGCHPLSPSPTTLPPSRVRPSRGGEGGEGSRPRPGSLPRCDPCEMCPLRAGQTPHSFANRLYEK